MFIFTFFEFLEFKNEVQGLALLLTINYFIKYYLFTSVINQIILNSSPASWYIYFSSFWYLFCIRIDNWIALYFIFNCIFFKHLHVNLFLCYTPLRTKTMHLFLGREEWAICEFFFFFYTKPVKITGSNIVVFCVLITILNTLLITMQNVLHLLF